MCSSQECSSAEPLSLSSLPSFSADRRISRHQMFMMFAEAAARRSTCRRLNVGCVIVWKNSCVSVGYNGPPSGEEHCTGPLCGIPSCTRALHAETNALARVPAHVPLDECTVYVTNSPCPTCTIKLVESGVRTVVFRDEYRLVDHLQNFLAARVRLLKLTPSGFMIDFATGEFIND
jgi:dCMP deaminase